MISSENCTDTDTGTTTTSRSNMPPRYTVFALFAVSLACVGLRESLPSHLERVRNKVAARLTTTTAMAKTSAESTTSSDIYSHSYNNIARETAKYLRKYNVSTSYEPVYPLPKEHFCLQKKLGAFDANSYEELVGTPLISLEEMLQGEGLQLSDEPTTVPAVCEYTHFMLHFPHFLENMLLCWSYWRSRPNQQPVLVPTEPKTFDGWMRLADGKPYGKGAQFKLEILKLIREQVNLTILPSLPTKTKSVRHVFPPAHQAQYAATSREVVREFRDLVITDALEQEQQQAKIELVDDDEDEDAQKQPPLWIGVLGRESNRQLVNMEIVSRMLQHQFPEAHLSQAFFENATFADQQNFMVQHDIVVSPHGAQLTGIFMMRPCSVVLEIAPRGYYIPHYFGSLANMSNLVFGSLYHSQGDRVAETLNASRTLDGRIAARSQNLCPDVTQVADAVVELLEQREECLRTWNLTETVSNGN